MSVNSRTVNYGTAGGSQINVDHGPRIEHGAPVKVQLSANYTLSRDPGSPTRPSMTGCAVANMDIPNRVVTSGTIITVLKAEADALVAAGKATLV